MKTLTLALLTLTLAFEASAQRRPNGGDRGPGRVAPAPGRAAPNRTAPAPGRVVTRRPQTPAPAPARVVTPPPGHRRPVVVAPRQPNRPVRVVPRYVQNPYSRRSIRTVLRPTIVWTQPFGYACTSYNQLMRNGRVIHSFQRAHECQQAIQDIRVYGDFCDKEDLYDQSGLLEAQFTFSFECRDALGYYY